MTQTKDKLDPYQQAIKDYLDKRAEEDPAFAEKYRAGLAGKKDIRACCNYIVEQVRKTGRRGFSDPEIYGMAMHFYDEDSVEPPKGNPMSGAKVIVNREIKLTEEDKKRIEKEARQKVEAEERAKAEKKIRDEQEKARKREEKKAQKAKEAAEAKKKQQEAAGFGFLFSDEDFK